MSPETPAGALSYDRGETEPALLETTIGVTLAATAAAHPDRDALVDIPAGRRWTYAQLIEGLRRLATGLLGAGVRRGDRVGIWAPNCWEWVFTQFATAEIGAVLVNINPAYRADELRYTVRQSGLAVLISARTFKTSQYDEIIDEVAPDCPDLREVIYTDSPRWAALCDTPADPVLLEQVSATLSASDPINIQYTSGTTGQPKGATLSHRNVLNNGYMIGELLGYTEADRACITVPFYHCFGMVLGNMAVVTHGAAIVIPARGFDPAATLRAVQSERCTSLYGVPTMFIAELELPDFADYDLSSLRTGIMAGTICPVEVMRAVIERMHMAGVAICYGMTETSPVSTQTRSDDSLQRRVETVGRVCPHLEIKLIDPDTGRTVPRRTPGELCTRGYSVMSGYWNDPQQTADAIDSDGWMHSGDLATMDDDGYVRITGRIKDMVIRGGENIYPREIEDFLYTHPDIVDVQVVGVPDEKYGEALMAVVILRDGAPELTVERLRDFCRGHLAHFKIPSYVQVVDSFPMTVTGKIRKDRLREEGAEYVRSRAV